MQMTISINQHEYTALVSGAAIQDRRDAGLIVLTGADRVDFLQRMTTADVAALGSGQAALAVLTSPVARIESVFTILCRGDDLWLLPSPGQAEGLAAKLRSQIFFMDKVKVEDAGPEYARLRVVGPRASDALQSAGLAVPESDDTFVVDGSVTLLRQERYDVAGYELILPSDQTEDLLSRLTEAGAVALTDADSVAWETRRVELGRPVVGAELTGDYNPLEAGLAWSVADNKGCYTGQEIIARQITYDKVTKTLVGLRSDSPLTPGAQLTADGRSVGQITSSAFSPEQNVHLALAVVKRPHNEPGSRLATDSGSAQVVALPNAFA